MSILFELSSFREIIDSTGGHEIPSIHWTELLIIAFSKFGQNFQSSAKLIHSITPKLNSRTHLHYNLISTPIISLWSVPFYYFNEESVQNRIPLNLIILIKFWRGVQFMKLFLMEFSLASYHLSKLSTNDPTGAFIEHLQTMKFPFWEHQIRHTKNTVCKYVFSYILLFTALHGKREERDIEQNGSNEYQFALDLQKIKLQFLSHFQVDLDIVTYSKHLLVALML